MDSEAPSWGIEPVPDRLRTLGGLDTTLLWTSLGLSLLVLVAGAVLVPALSLKAALLAIVVGALIGNAMLGLAALIGTDGRVPAMVLLRAPLGRDGSYVATALNVLQNLGWTVFELIVIAAAASALSEQVFGFRAEWLWKLVAAGATTALALLGPVGFVRRWVKRFALWVVLASLGYLTWWALRHAQLATLWSQPGKGGFPNFWQGVDLVIAMPASWLPLAADYTRFSTSRSASFWGTALGYLFANVWLFALGAILLLSRSLADAPSVMSAIAAGGAGGAVALLALGIDETKEPFANVYSTAVSLQNVLPGVSQRLLIVSSAGLATAGALVLDLSDFATFLFLLGSVFVPLFGVLFADWLVNGARYTREKIFDGPAVRVEMIVAWLVGFGLFQWLSPVGPAGWTEWWYAHTDPAPIDFTASLPSFAAAFGLALVASLVVRRRPAAAFARS